MTATLRPPIRLADATASLLTAPTATVIDPPPSRYPEETVNRVFLVVDNDARNELQSRRLSPDLLTTCRPASVTDTDAVIDRIVAAFGNPPADSRVIVTRALVQDVNVALHEPVQTTLRELTEDPRLRLDPTVDFRQAHCHERAMASQTVHLAEALGYKPTFDGGDLFHGNVSPAPWKS